METSRNQDRIRFRYGICLNEKCEKSKTKEVLEIPARKEFVCPECGKPLRECPPPRKSSNKWLYIAACALLVIGGLAWWLLSGGEDKPEPRTPPERVAQHVDSIKSNENDSTVTVAEGEDAEAMNEALKKERDSLQNMADSLRQTERQRQQAPVVAEKPAPAPQPTPAPAPTPKANASPQPVQTATSGTKNLGYATFKGTWPNDVNGRMIFKTSHIIDSRDPKGRMAEPGDYVIGEFSEGHLVQGIWYGADNQVKGSIIIGK